jgi:hypothetical protein
VCNFLSAIVLKNLDVIWDYKCSGHEELISKYKLNDDAPYYLEKFCRVEFVPLKTCT